MKSYFFAFIFILSGITTIAGNINKINAEGNSINITKKTQTSNLYGINPLDTVYFDLYNSKFTGNYIDIPIFINAIDTINSLDFSLKYNHTNFKYDSVIVNVPYLSGVNFYENASDSTVRFTSYSPTVMYENFTPIVYVRFKIISSYFGSTDFYSLKAYLNGESVGTRLLDGVMWLASSMHNPSCNNVYDGSINMSVYGGIPPFSYLWSNGDTTSNLQYISAGTYYLTVSDNSGYIRTDSITLIAPSLLLISKNPTCASFTNGSIDLSVIGGTAPFHYNWSNFDTTKNVNFLPSGTYNVTVTDASGCSLLGTQILTDSITLNINNNINTPSCPGSQNGSLTVDATGGFAPYSYLWSNSGTTNTINSLIAGSYAVTVTDHNGCKYIESISLPDPPLLMTLLHPTNLSDPNINDGSIKLFITGGTSPYSYLWSNAATVQNIDSLWSGMYYVTVTDSKGCSTIDSAFVDNPTVMYVNMMKTDVLCYNSNNGSSQAIPQNGTPPFTYNWSTGDTTQTINNLSPGMYIVTVTQGNNSKSIDSVNILSATKIDISLQKTDPTCPLSTDGAAQVIAQGGSPPYFYSWSNSGSADTINNLTKGTYSITVTDANSCIYFSSIDLKPIGDNCIVIYSGFTPNGDGNNDVWNIKGIDSYPDCIVNIYNQWGENVFSSKGYEKPWDGTDKGKKLPSAVYYYIIDIGGGEKYSGSVFLLK